MGRTLRRVLIGLLAMVLAAVAGGVSMLTQPLLSGVARPQGATRPVDARRLEQHVRMLSEKLVPRDWSHPENLDRVAAWVGTEFREMRARVSEQAYVAARRPYRNVVGSFGPERGERIVIGAHYDSFEAYPAADDNASGVAALIELAGLLGETRDLPVRVDLVAYTLEEPPAYRTEWMGSWVHARSLRAEGVRLRAMISLEMVGYFSDAPDSQALPHPWLGLFYPTTGNFITVIGRLGDLRLTRRVKAAMRRGSDLGVYSMNAPRWIPGIDFSDHRSFWDHGYPAVMITDTAFYRNDRYHTPRDTPDTLQYGRMAQVVQGVYQAVLALSR